MISSFPIFPWLHVQFEWRSRQLSVRSQVLMLLSGIFFGTMCSALQGTPWGDQVFAYILIFDQISGEGRGAGDGVVSRIPPPLGQTIQQSFKVQIFCAAHIS